MKIFNTKNRKFGATKYADLIKIVRRQYHIIERRTRRRPYIRSAYFKKDKIFLELYWKHIDQKSSSERRRRLRFFSCGIELIEKSHVSPISKQNVNRKNEILHRFAGIERGGDLFYVQIKEDIKANKKYLMSIFSPH